MFPYWSKKRAKTTGCSRESITKPESRSVSHWFALERRRVLANTSAPAVTVTWQFAQGTASPEESVTVA